MITEAIEVKRTARQAAQMEQFIDTYADRFERGADAILTAEGRRVVAAYEAGGEAAAMLAPEQSPWMEYLTRTWVITAPDAAEVAASWLGITDKAKNPRKEAIAAAARNQVKRIGPDKAAGMIETSKAMITGVIAGAEPANGPRLLLMALINAYTDKKKKRSRKIAYSEVHESANYGTMEAASSLYRALDKVWVSKMDGRQRDAHGAAHGQRKRLDQHFIVMGERLNFPGDSSLGAGPELTINCRCQVIYQSRNDRVE